MSKCDFNKLKKNYIEITLRHECSRENLLHIFRTPFPKNTSCGLFLDFRKIKNFQNSVVHL